MTEETEVPAPEPKEDLGFNPKPVKIRDQEYWPPVFPAPMCGISDHAWRKLSREQGCPLVYTQMVSCEAMERGSDEKCWRLLDLDPTDNPVCAQVFGADPDRLAATAARLRDAGATIVDLNMGCPVNKVVNSRGGSALMREPDLVREIFGAMRAALPDIPFTVKFRAGWDKYGEEGMIIAKLAEEMGLDAICIHGRTRQQKFKGHADWSILKEVKKHVTIPVIGNGDVKTADDAERMFRETGVDGVMVGRGAMGNPWVFGQIIARFKGETDPEQIDILELLDTVERHAALMVDRKGEYGLIEFRKHAVSYLKGFPSAKQLKKTLLGITDFGEYRKELSEARLALASS